jgi:hypothetical protein
MPRLSDLNKEAHSCMDICQTTAGVSVRSKAVTACVTVIHAPIVCVYQVWYLPLNSELLQSINLKRALRQLDTTTCNRDRRGRREKPYIIGGLSGRATVYNRLLHRTFE